MRPLDRLRGVFQGRQELAELRTLAERLHRYQPVAAKRTPDLAVRIAARAIRTSLEDNPPEPLMQAVLDLIEALLDYEGVFGIPQLPPLDRALPTAEVWELRAFLTRQLGFFEDPSQIDRIEQRLCQMLAILLERFEGGGAAATQVPEEDAHGIRPSAPLHALLRDLPQAVEDLLRVNLTGEAEGEPFARLQATLTRNLALASGMEPSQLEEKSRKKLTLPSRAKDQSPDGLVRTYLAGTPFSTFLASELAFPIPFTTRFEHTHVVGGSGHGKTQLLQQLILGDLAALEAGRGSLIVIDSQGDLIRAITHLAAFSPGREGSLAERLVLIDPNDIEHPPALNLFDVGLDRLERYSPVEREKLINGAIALYEYIFGALLGAELTQRQGVIFRYLAQLLMVVPGATIHTLRGFMEEPESTAAYYPALEPLARQFFQTQFLSKTFDDTRQQILTRLWGVLSNRVLARMFSHEKNRLDLFSAMNRGSVILVHTAKELLKQDGCEILGRFFLALITQATQERASIPADRRRATFLYVDEAQDYFDESVEQLFNQARKYKVGVIAAHQNLDQLDKRLQAAVMASTAIKLAGGCSAKDAAAFAKEMRCEPELIQGMRKHARHTEFACWVKNATPRPLRLAVPFGQLEGRERISEAEHEELLALNRSRYSADAEEAGASGMMQSRSPAPKPSGGFELGKHEVL